VIDTLQAANRFLIKLTWAALCILSLLVLLLGGCKHKELRGPLTVTGGNSPVEVLAGKLAVLALRQNGFEVNDRTGSLTAAEARSELLSGSADIGWFYTGEIWSHAMGHDLPFADAEQLAYAVTAEDRQRGIIWLSPAPYVLKPGLVMRDSEPVINTLVRTSDLTAYAAGRRPLVLCAPGGLVGGSLVVQDFLRAYGLDFSGERLRSLSVPEGYQALLRGDCDCALGYSVDVAGNNALHFLEDDKAFLPVSGFALAIRQEVYEQYPDIQQVLDKVSLWLTPATVSSLVRQVDLENQSPELVAQQFIKLQK
jgi:osmoprotectant transport system substrate-binding protein